MNASVSADYGLALSDLANEAEQDCLGGKAAYKVIRDKKAQPFMALSCIEQGPKAFYTKAVLCKDLVTQIEFTYPEAEKSAWDSVVSRMASSLGAGCGAD